MYVHAYMPFGLPLCISKAWAANLKEIYLYWYR